MAKLVLEETSVNYDLMMKAVKVRDHHNELMSQLHEMKAHIHPSYHSEFNKHLMDMYNSFGRMKDLINKNVSKVK